jgi:hypothetical protein
VINETDAHGKPRWPRLNAAALAVVGRQSKTNKVTPRDLGYWATRSKHRFVSGLRITSGKKKEHGVPWWVERNDGKDIAGGYTKPGEQGAATNGAAPGGDEMTLKLTLQHDTAGSPKAKGAGASLFSRDDGDVAWFPNEVIRTEDGPEGYTLVTVSQKVAASRQWQKPNPRFAEPTPEELAADGGF